jgi:eukaryotic-like serine/threonine-protein kinase
LCMQVSHPNVVTVFDCGFDRHVHYLIMELVDGCTLAAHIDEMGPMPWQEAAKVMLQIAAALGQVHAQNIIHRDIKPANILLAPDGTAKLADLGLGKNLEEATQDGSELTMQGTVLGSPAYMAPEQVRNSREATPIADIYSLGATFYQALTGEPPFTGRNSSDVMMKVLREEPKPLQERVPGIPRGISTLIQRTMAKDLKKRPQTAAQFIDELKAVIAKPERSSKSSKLSLIPVKGDGSPLVSNTMLLVIAGVLLVAVIVAISYVIWWM